MVHVFMGNFMGPVVIYLKYGCCDNDMAKISEDDGNRAVIICIASHGFMAMTLQL